MKSAAPTLTKHLSRLTHASFDPQDQEHLKAFQMLVLEGRQHPSLRFDLEHPFLDVRAMMVDKVSRAYLAVRGQLVHG